MTERFRPLSERGINFSNPSTIFIAGYAMNTSMTTEKTRVSTIFNILFYPVVLMNKKEFFWVFYSDIFDLFAKIVFDDKCVFM